MIGCVEGRMPFDQPHRRQFITLFGSAAPFRQCGGRVAALGARAIAGNAGDRIHQRPVAGGSRRANVAYWQIVSKMSFLADD